MGKAALYASHDKAIEFILRLHSCCAEEEAFRRVIAFMVSYLSLMRDVLPYEATAALAAAQEYSLNVNRIDEAIAARIECWKYLKSTGRENDFESREARGIRAVMCALTTESNDLTELVSWFLEFADGVEDHSSQIEGLLERQLG